VGEGEHPSRAALARVGELLAVSANKSPTRPGWLAAVTVLASLAALLLAACGSSSGGSDTKAATAAAKKAYARAKASGEDLGPGPCIAERLPGLGDWVVDIAHDPRQPVDEVPANQCRRFRAGEAHHFVELTPRGRVIRAQ
jgi:hypothetical protein